MQVFCQKLHILSTIFLMDSLMQGETTLKKKMRVLY